MVGMPEESERAYYCMRAVCTERVSSLLEWLTDVVAVRGEARTFVFSNQLLFQNSRLSRFMREPIRGRATNMNVSGR